MKAGFAKLGGVVGFALMLLHASQAQAVFSTETGTPTPQVTISMDLTLESAITLTITAIAGTTFASETSSTTGSATATVNFGTVNTTCTYNITNGKCIRFTTGGTGAFFVASFRAQVDVAGIAPADGDIGISTATPVVAGRDIRYALCPGNACTSSTTTDPSWVAFGSGIAVPAVSAGTEIANELASGGGAAVVEHQLAIRLLDTFATTGAMTDVDILYTASNDP